MDVKPKPNSFLRILSKATAVVGLFAIVQMVSSATLSTYLQQSDFQAEASSGSKQFDFGTANGNGIPSGTDSPHLVSHTSFHSVRLGNAVDAPETSPNDSSGAGDQDGLDTVSSNAGGIYVNLWHTVGDNATDFWSHNGQNPTYPSVESHPRTRLGTLIVGHYKKTGDSYNFEMLGASPVRWHDKATYVPFSQNIGSSEEGWLRVVYTQLDLTTACGGNFSGCQTGFTLNNLAGWDGTHGGLMNIMYGYPLSDPFDVSIPPGEVEDYLYCSNNGVTKYYKPNDSAFASECGSSAGTPTEGEETENPTSEIAAIYQPECSPLVYFQVNVLHPREMEVDFKVQQSLDNGVNYEAAVVASATGLNGNPTIDNEEDKQVQGIRTDVGPETVALSINTEDFVEETTDKFRIRVTASDDRVSSSPLDTQSFTVTYPGDCGVISPFPDPGEPPFVDPIPDPGTDTFPEDPIDGPPGSVDDEDGGGNGGGGGGGGGGPDLSTFINFLIGGGFNPNEFSTSIARELSTRIAIHILLMNDKITLADINSQTEAIYPDSSVETRPGREIALATLLGVVQGYPDGRFLPQQNPTVVESYQIISELGRYMSPDIARVLEEEKVKAVNSPDWFEAYLQTFRRFGVPTGRNYFELGEKITTVKFVELVQQIFSKVGLSDPFVRQPDLAEGRFRSN